MRKLLFFDDHFLTVRNNVARKTGKPEMLAESIYRDPFQDDVNLRWGYPFVFRDEENGKWRMLYQGWPVDRQRLASVVAFAAESEDGIRWEPTDTRPLAALDDRRFPHQLLPLQLFGGQFGESQFFVDERAEPQERFKALAIYRLPQFQFKSCIFVSPNGLQWTLKEGAEWHKGDDAPDYPISIFWNEVRERYTLIARPAHADRRVSVAETTDWSRFSEPELALQPDALDQPLTQMYGMSVFPYDGYYLGFLLLYHPTPYHAYFGQRVSSLASHKFIDGHVECQLAYSLNGRHYLRALRDTFIGLGEPGAPDFGCAYPTSLVRREREMLIYASAGSQEHGRVTAGSGAIAAYRLRPDGFVYLESGNGFGELTTRCIWWNSGELHLNAWNPGGEIRVQIADQSGQVLEGYAAQQCVPFAGDELDWTPQWTSGKRMSELAGSVITIDIVMRGTRLYAISGDCLPLIVPQVEAFHHSGKIPEERPGF